MESWRVICELFKLGCEADLLYRPYKTLSFGEQTKVMLAVLFSGGNDFLLIDEPTNHLDREARTIVKAYLSEKRRYFPSERQLKRIYRQKSVGLYTAFVVAQTAGCCTCPVYQKHGRFLRGTKEKGVDRRKFADTGASLYMG